MSNTWIDRRCWLVAIVLVTIAVTSQGTTSAENATRPNIVLIISDDQTSTDFGFMGHAQVQTPHLDRLASRSARYINGYVPSSVCRPSLVTILTGLYPHQHGVYFNHPPPGFSALTNSPEIDKPQYDALRERGAQQIHQIPTLPRLLAAHGYRCLQTGKYWEGHWRNAGFTDGMTIAQPSGGPHGDKVLPNGDVVAHGNGDHGLSIGRQSMQPIADFLDDVDEAPFLIWYAPFLPHSPHDAPQESFDRFTDADVPRHCLPYYAAIAQFDDTVGVLLQLIEERDLTDNSVFAFVVDNGWTPDPNRPVTSRREWDHTLRSKRAPFEDGVRTPILLRWDREIVPATHSELVSSIDLVPTLLEAAGIDAAPLNLPGESLLPSAAGASRLDDQRPVFGEIYPGDASRLGDPAADIAYRWVRQGRYKLIVPHAHHGRAPWKNFLSTEAIYDVVADPGETRNLIEQPELGQVTDRLRRLLDEWWMPTEEP